MANEAVPTGTQEQPKAAESTSQALGEKQVETPSKPAETVEKPTEPPKQEEVKDAPKPEGKQVPDKYELKLPDGALIDPKRVDEIAAFAKAQGLSNEQAQGILERENGAVSSFVQNQNETIKAKTESWVSEVKADKELGGDNFPQTVEAAKRAVDKFATPDFKKHLEETGLGNHPELVRVFARIGKAMSDDSSVFPNAQTGGKKSIEDIFYPKQ